MKSAVDTKPCDCRICKRYRRHREVLRGDDINALRDLIYELQSALMHSEDDANYYQAIVDGSWASADEIIAFSRKKLKEETDE